MTVLAIISFVILGVIVWGQIKSINDSVRK